MSTRRLCKYEVVTYTATVEVWAFSPPEAADKGCWAANEYRSGVGVALLVTNLGSEEAWPS
jgi:hypothetical protein